MTESMVVVNPQQRHLADRAAKKKNTDIILYNGEISRPEDQKFIEACVNRLRRVNVTLILVTSGGDPDAAYRIARCLQSNYSRFSLLVCGPCKSAGTLVAVGANELIISDHGELGPLDIQMRKKDELIGMQSGLVVLDALEFLRRESSEVFDHIWLRLHGNSDGAITFTTAADLSARITSELIGKLYSQIDPLVIGEAERAINIARTYGDDLRMFGRNMIKSQLERLISRYPSHGYVIDFEEAEFLFENVRRPTKRERKLINALGTKAYQPKEGEAALSFLNSEVSE